MKRRTFIVGCGSATAVTVAGCLGSTGLTEYSSTAARVAGETREETGFEEIGVEPIEVRERFEVSDHEEEIVVRNYVTEHEKTIGVDIIGEQAAAVYYVFTSPEIGIAGVNLNPIDEMDTDEIIDLVRNNYDEIGATEHQEDEAIHILGEATTSSLYTAEAEFDGVTLDVYIRVSEPVKTENGDFLSTIGVWPQTGPDEDENVLLMSENVLANRD